VSVSLTSLLDDAAVAAAQADPFAREVVWTDVAIRSDSATCIAYLDFAPSPLMRGCPLVADHGFAVAYRLRVGSTTLALAWMAAGRGSVYLSEAAAHHSVRSSPACHLRCGRLRGHRPDRCTRGARRRGSSRGHGRAHAHTAARPAERA